MSESPSLGTGQYLPVEGPSSEIGVMGEAQRPSDREGECDPEEVPSGGCGRCISRCHNRQEIFSSRRPSFNDSLHFVNTGCGA